MADPRGVPLWHSLTIERRFIPDQRRMTYQPPQDWFTIVAPLHGLCQVEYPDGSGWHQTTLVSGDTSRLVGKSAVRLMRPPAGKQRVEVAFIAVTERFSWPLSVLLGPAERDVGPSVSSLLHSAADEFVVPGRSKLVTPQEWRPPCRSFSSTSSPP
jgi:hypothetical protein